MVTCSAWGCKNRSQRINGAVGYHAFPLKNPALLQKWLDALHISSGVVNRHCRVCSEHFSPADYKRDLRHELIGTRKKRQLREDAVPSIRCSKSSLIMDESTSAERLTTLQEFEQDVNPVNDGSEQDINPVNDETEEDTSHMEDTEEAADDLDGRVTRDPLSDPLAEDDNMDIIPEFEVKEEPYDFYEDNVTDTGSPCWISDGVTLIGENDEDIELEDVIQLEDNSDPLDYVDKPNNILLEDTLDILPAPQRLPKKDGIYKQKLFRQPRKFMSSYVPYEVDIDDDLDDGLMVTVENASSYRDELNELGWKNKRLTDSEMARRRRELENILMKCKVNIKVMQARLDEERGKMLRIQNSLINLRRRQKRHEMKKMQFGGGVNDSREELADRTKGSQMDVEIREPMTMIKIKEEDQRRYESAMEVKLRMARLREMKARKALEQKNSGVVDYHKELETKLRMARLREIKAQKALERKLNIDSKSPESSVKAKIKLLKIPKQEECVNGEDYEKMLEMKLKMARLREMKAMKALEKVNNEDSDRTAPVVVEKIKIKKPKLKRLKIKMKTVKPSVKPYDEEKAMEMKVKMAKLREIKAQKALERKKMEELGLVTVKDKFDRKKGLEKLRKVDAEKQQNSAGISGEAKAKEDIRPVSIKTEEKESKPEIHIATSHMLWNVLSRIKMEPYQESTSKTNPADLASSYLSNQAVKNSPLPSDIPQLVKNFMHRDDVSKVSTTSPYATTSDKSLTRFRMHYLPILHKQFEAENGNVCSYASFCSYVPENVTKPHGWKWRFCPCLPCINPELKFEKMISEGILKMEGVELGDILYDDSKESILMVQLRELKDSRQFFTYDAWERNSSGTINAKRRTASEPIPIVVTKFLEELSTLKSHIQRSFYQYHAAKLARDRGLHCADEVTLHIECSPLSVHRNPGTEPNPSDPVVVFTFLTGYLWSQNCEQTLAAVSENKDYSTSGIWAGLEKILLSIVKAGKKKINIISDCPTNKYRNKSTFYYMSDFARMYGVCFRWIFLELSHQIGNANIIRDEIERTIKEQLNENPDMSLAKSEVQKMLLAHTSIIVDSYSHEDVQKYKLNLPKLKVVQGTQKFDEVIILPEDFWVRDVIGFDTFKKLPF